MERKIHTQGEPSNLLLLLSNMECLIETCTHSARSTSRKALLLVLADEAELLMNKCQRMRQRWSVYLPFHEAIDVCFLDWAKKVDLWMDCLCEQEDSPSTGFLLDLVRRQPIEPLRGDLSRLVPAECARVDCRLQETITDWETTCCTNPPSAAKLLSKVEGEQLQAALMQLTLLRNELKELEEFFSSELSMDQFKILALRLRHRDCDDTIREAKKQVSKAHNSWPPRYEPLRASLMKDEIKLDLLKDEKLQELKDYISLDDPELYEEACFGQFLFKHRHHLSIQDVQELVKKLEIIILLNEKYIDPKGKLRKREKAAAGRVLSDEQKKIAKALETFIAKVEWRGGATGDSILQGMKRMLGIGYSLDEKMLSLSDLIWRLLTSRRRCNQDKSLRVTWLNIVGWCIRQGLLSGTSPSLCRTFFPDSAPDDYKAIDKGRNDPPTVFQKVEPLLERFLK